MPGRGWVGATLEVATGSPVLVPMTAGSYCNVEQIQRPALPPGWSWNGRSITPQWFVVGTGTTTTVTQTNDAIRS